MVHPDVARAWHATSNTLALLVSPDEASLERLARRAHDSGIAVACFREPDIGNALTALALEASPTARRICANLPLTLAGV